MEKGEHTVVISEKSVEKCGRSRERNDFLEKTKAGKEIKQGRVSYPTCLMEIYTNRLSPYFFDLLTILHGLPFSLFHTPAK
jgi:hypothetical protein